MKTTIKSINNISLTGFIVSDPEINETKTRAIFRVLHPFGGDKDDVVLTFKMFGDEKTPLPVQLLKKGKNVSVTAFCRPSTYKNGEDFIIRTDYIVKTLSASDSANDFSLSGRLTADAVVNDAGNRCTFSIAHNFGGDTGVQYIDVVMFSKKGEFPSELLKKGTPVVAHCYFAANNYTNAQGEKKYRTQFIIKSVEPAEMIEGQE